MEFPRLPPVTFLPGRKLDRLTMENADPFLIVGAGPIGLYTALLLARHGLSSTIVEQFPSNLRAPKAHVVNPRTLEIFRQTGLDLARLRQVATPAEDSAVVRFAASLAGREYGMVPFERQDPGVLEFTPTPLMNIPQPYLEDYLASLVAAQPRVTVRREHMWSSVEQQDGRCRSAIEGPGGAYTFDSEYLLACDGAGSSVREMLEIPMDGTGGVQSCLTLHVKANLRPVVRDRPAIIYWVINPQAAGAFVAHDIDSNWIFIRFDGVGEFSQGAPTMDEARALIRAAIGADVDFEILRMAPWLMTAEVAANYRAGNVFLVGDAAHRFPPNGGLGMNTGLQDAHNLAWKLAAVKEGWADPGLLDSYERERRGVARANSEQSLSNALSAPRLIGALVAASEYIGQEMPADLAAEVEEAIRLNAVTFGNLGLQLGFSYNPGKPLPPAPDVYDPSADPGDRLPHAWLSPSGAKRSTLDLLPYDRFTLFHTRAGSDFAAAAQTALAPMPLKVVEAGEALGFPEDWLALTGLDRPAMLIVRPDGHVLARVEGVSAAALSALAAEWTAYVSRSAFQRA